MGQSDRIDPAKAGRVVKAINERPRANDDLSGWEIYPMGNPKQVMGFEVQYNLGPLESEQPPLPEAVSAIIEAELQKEGLDRQSYRVRPQEPLDLGARR